MWYRRPATAPFWWYAWLPTGEVFECLLLVARENLGGITEATCFFLEGLWSYGILIGFSIEWYEKNPQHLGLWIWFCSIVFGTREPSRWWDAKSPNCKYFKGMLVRRTTIPNILFIEKRKFWHCRCCNPLQCHGAFILLETTQRTPENTILNELCVLFWWRWTRRQIRKQLLQGCLERKERNCI